MNINIPHYDVAIVGGGMVGLTLALALAEQGFRLALIDSQAAPASVEELRATTSEAEFDARVSALTLASQALLQKLGVWDSLASLRVCAYRDMQVWDADGTGSVHFTAEEVHRTCLGHIVENRLTVAVLHEAASRHPGIEISNATNLATIQLADNGSDYSEITCDNGTTLRCRLLIGADGGNSLVRKQCGFATREWSYEQQALVCTVRTERAHQFTAWQRFMQSGPLAFLPLQLAGADAQHYSSIVWSCDSELAATLQALGDADFMQQLQQAFESRLGRIESCSPRFAFPLHQQHAEDYVKPGVALVGDAAHTIHPLAGQGVNLGLADVETLTDVLQQARQRGESIATLQTLSRYQRQRKGPNLGMMLGMEAFKRAFGSDELAVRWLRNAGLRLADHMIPVKRVLIKHAMGLPL